MFSIGVITSTRAEFGLLFPFINELRKREDKDTCVSLVVTGTHLSKEYGYTVDEIKKLGVRIDYEIDIRTDSKTANDIARNQADTVVKFTDFLTKNRFDAICILGDRYEMQMIAIAAVNTGTAIIHLCGGDTTEGAIDESIRHSITKMSQLHFVTNAMSRRRVIQLGENPDMVYDVGSTSIDNILGLELEDKSSALKSINMDVCEYAIGTYHPVTQGNQNIEEDMLNFINALKEFPNIQFIITKANADKGGSIINEILEKEEKQIDNLHVFSSLGVKRYLSLMKYSEFVIGNSSSGIVEAPALHKVTINIGDRQRGRLQSKGTINCDSSTTAITEAIKLALSSDARRIANETISPYGNGDSAIRMTRILFDILNEKPLELKKQFFDLE